MNCVRHEKDEGSKTIEGRSGLDDISQNFDCTNMMDNFPRVFMPATVLQTLYFLITKIGACCNVAILS